MTPTSRPRADAFTFQNRRHYEMTEQVFRFICNYVAEHTHPPTLDEIAAGCYIARSTVVRHIDRLEGEGRISRNPNKSRGITLLAPCLPLEAFPDDAPIIPPGA